ncbi:hypothetical protein FGSG_13942 [Fusarium graminearum PH-1]|uniref:hypothetical protein n=1 Tax=Gibberella zeae (strain ATCC MYA-4620 / CBS 123657 / FGSC 9075 / NRRL 31084 / PH-1) TaxID=229533 RepID=UPI00021EF577|nr:hypothetical protein FGSG_13942 [Fusarium graminearum PH-1]ESU18111.1 hypothetical protein FGSG_13942 [Fusarium graminearum PH-1]|eukprot:XP_011325733.1 hypothetical protein FGSG_13942 [Fusarium graminearum PH-1]
MSSGTTSTVPKTSLLGLPLKLREQIYRHYFKATGGYVYDAATETLSGCEMHRKDGDPDDMGDDYDASILPRMNRKFGDKTIVFNDTVAYLLRILAKRHPDQLAQAVDVMLPGWPDSHPASEVLDLKFEP